MNADSFFEKKAPDDEAAAAADSSEAWASSLDSQAPSSATCHPTSRSTVAHATGPTRHRRRAPQPLVAPAMGENKKALGRPRPGPPRRRGSGLQVAVTAAAKKTKRKHRVVILFRPLLVNALNAHPHVARAPPCIPRTCTRPLRPRRPCAPRRGSAPAPWRF